MPWNNVLKILQIVRRLKDVMTFGMRILCNYGKDRPRNFISPQRSYLRSILGTAVTPFIDRWNPHRGDVTSSQVPPHRWRLVRSRRRFRNERGSPSPGKESRLEIRDRRHWHTLASTSMISLIVISILYSLLTAEYTIFKETEVLVTKEMCLAMLLRICRTDDERFNLKIFVSWIFLERATCFVTCRVR